MALVKEFVVEIYDDPQLALKDGTSRGYFVGVEGLIANLEASVKDYLLDKDLMGDLRHKERMDEIDKEIEEDDI